jgi:putative MFS transporter
MSAVNEDAAKLKTRSQIDARIDRLPAFGLPASVLVLLATLYFFAFYDITVVGVALPSITDDFHLSASQLGLPVTVNLIGYVVGAYLFGNVADYFGRRKALVGTLGVLSTGALLTAFSWDVLSLSVFRLIVGMGTGALISLAATYTTEVVPAKLRGRFTQINMFWAGIGLAVAPWIALPLVGFAGVGWRVLLGLGALAAVAMILMLRLPESPRWLAVHGRTEEAENIVTAMEQHVRDKKGLALPPVVPAPVEQSGGGFPTRTLFRPPYARRLVLVLIFWIAWYIVSYAILGYEPVLFKSMGMSAPNSLLFTALGDVAFPLGPLIAWLIIDRFQRRWIVAATSAAMAVAMIIFATAGGGLALIAGALLFALLIVPGAAAGYTYTSEQFPTHVRASATSIGDGIGHVGGVAAPTIALASLAAWGGRETFWLLAGIMIVGFAAIAIGGVSTTGRNLTALVAETEKEPPQAAG